MSHISKNETGKINISNAFSLEYPKYNIIGTLLMKYAFGNSSAVCCVFSCVPATLQVLVASAVV